MRMEEEKEKSKDKRGKYNVSFTKNINVLHPCDFYKQKTSISKQFFSSPLYNEKISNSDENQTDV